MSVGIEVYGRDDCKHTRAALDYLAERRLPHSYNDATKWARRRKSVAAGHSTVPMIFWDGVFIGGRDQLEQRFHATTAPRSWWTPVLEYQDRNDRHRDVPLPPPALRAYRADAGHGRFPAFRWASHVTGQVVRRTD